MAVVNEYALVVRNRNNSGSAIDHLGGVISDGFADGERESSATDRVLV